MDWMKYISGKLAERSRNGRLLLVLCFLSALLAGGIGVAVVSSLWAGGKARVQGAIVSGIFTLVAAIGGAFVVFWQLRRQAVNTITANKHNEAMKLKEKIYEQIVEACDTEMKANSEVFSYILRFMNEVIVHRIMTEQAVKSPSVPGVRFGRLSELVAEHAKTVNFIIGMTEKWEIIDPRVSIFRAAIHVRMKELLLAQTDYNALAIVSMPVDTPATPSFTGTFWIGVDQHKADELKEKGDRVRQALWNVGMCVNDYRTEMQNALLGELFEGKKAPVRQPLTPEFRPIELDNFEELMKYFEQHEHWGKAKDEATQRVRADLTARSRITS